MALPINIEELIHGKVIEWERLEFKKDWNPERVLHTLCAFANDINNWGGGYIILGVGESKGRPQLPPAGLSPDHMDDLQGELTRLGHRIHPHYLSIAQPYVLKGKHILVIWAPAGDMRPYSAPKSLGKGGEQRMYYVRSGSRTIQAQGENLRRLQELTARIPFDDRINQQGELIDFDLGLIREFLHEVKSSLAEESAAMSLGDLSRQLAIAKGPDEQLRPVNVGLMFFNKAPENFFRNAWIEVVIRKDEAGKDFSEKYFKGPLHHQLREALSYIRNHIIEERVSKVPDKAEAHRYVNFPYAALEEALANAVYHKSYEEPKPIEVQIWPHQIEILSFPGPVPPVDAQILAENRRIVARDYRNRRVGDFLKELHLTEGRGTGIPTMRKAMLNNGSPEPVLETDEQCTYFLTILPVHPEWVDESSGSDQVPTKYRPSGEHVVNKDRPGSDQVSEVNRASTGQVPGKYRASGEQVPTKYRLSADQVPTKYRSYVKEIETLISVIKGEMQFSEIMETLQLRHKPHFRDNYLQPTLKSGYIEMTIPDKPKSSKQKYRLTDKGRKLREHLKREL